jgi:hypothetical protein
MAEIHAAELDAAAASHADSLNAAALHADCDAAAAAARNLAAWLSGESISL